MIRKTLAPLVLLLAALPAAAEVDTYAIDPAHSEVAFQVRHLVTKVRGEFRQFEGDVRIDWDNPADSSVRFTIAAPSISTANDDRDKHLRSQDFFWVDKYPELSFVSSEVKPTGKDSYDVTGTLTIRGVGKQVTLPVTYLGEAKDPWGNVKAGFSTAIVLNRQDFGMKWNAALDQGGFLLGDEVWVDISLETKKQPAPAAAGK
jgi:polyisoprenoid-binding protein YceI